MPKKTKDPNAPKRPMTAYFLWLQENRNRIKKDGMGAADVAKLAGAEWRSLEDSDKLEWQKRADGDKERYSREMGEYNKKDNE